MCNKKCGKELALAVIVFSLLQQTEVITCIYLIRARERGEQIRKELFIYISA